MKNLNEKFNAFILHENLFLPHDRLVLAVSGGLDSVVLLELCHQSGFDFGIAHCNFHLRGEESERDEAFVRTLAQKYQRAFHVRKFDTEGYAKNIKVSIQVAARELRYGWFNTLIDDKSDNVPHSYSYIVTAHHLDDSVETMLMNFFKGTGIYGMHGILAKQGKIVRPLLFARKEELKDFALASNLYWIEDSSNLSDGYSRNYLRHNIIPSLKEKYPNLTGNMSENISRFKEVEILYRQSIEIHKKKLIEERGNEFHIPVLKLKKAIPLHTIVYEIIKVFGFSGHQVYDLLKLLDSESGKYIQSATHRIFKNRQWLIIAPNNTAQSAHLIVEGAGRWFFADGELNIQLIQNMNDKWQISSTVVSLDADKVQFPILVRKWKPGDYFYPLGLRKKKKLGRFFIDNKLSKTDKEKIWVLESNKKIAWIMGVRADDRVKITPQTKNVLKIEIRMA